MLTFSSRRRWMIVLYIFAGGTLCQTTCSASATEFAAGLTSSVASQFIRNVVFDFFQVSSVSF